jgi:hypothetical protein
LDRRARLARPFVRVFAPLVLLMAAMHLAATVLVDGAGFGDRDLLMQFHGLLGLVFVTLLLAVAVRRVDAAPSRSDLVMFGLAVVALAIDMLVLGAVAERIIVHGPTPKRWVAAGAGVVILGQLAVLLRSCARVWQGRAPIAAVRDAVAGYLPIFVVWARKGDRHLCAKAPFGPPAAAKVPVPVAVVTVKNDEMGPACAPRRWFTCPARDRAPPPGRRRSIGDGRPRPRESSARGRKSRKRCETGGPGTCTARRVHEGGGRRCRDRPQARAAHS